MPDFARRSSEIEIMDDLNCSGEVIHQTLRELEFINKWLGGNAVTLNALDKLFQEGKLHTPITIADLGCGGGDMLKLINQWAIKRNLQVELVGIDANPHIIAVARENLKGLTNVSLHAMDIFSSTFEQLQFDFIVGTLFFHHFTEEQLIRFFRKLSTQVRGGMIINDIHRHPLAYHSIALLTKAFSRSPMVINDAPLSVLRAFKKHELAHLLKEAGYTAYTIHWKWAFRWQVIVLA